MAGDVRQLDHFRERVEVDTGSSEKVVGFDKPHVHVVSRDKAEAHRWAARNRPAHYVKVHHPDSTTSMRGLYLRDESVFVLHGMSREVRDCWIVTSAKLVYL